MTGRDRREGDNDRRHNVPDNAPNTGDMNAPDEQLEPTRGWTAEDRDVPSNAPNVGDLPADDEDVEDLLESAADALDDMRAHEMRQGGFHTRGDDLNPGIDTDVNAPKKRDLRE